jgi:hypothetical protein
MIKYCRENGIDTKDGKIDETLLQKFISQLPNKDKQRIERCTVEAESNEEDEGSGVNLNLLE